MAQKKSVPGILWVNSDVIRQDRLSRNDFNIWYCDEHIPDVVAKSGVKNAFRYEHIADDTTPERRLGFLTIYGMPDINFMETEEFRSLEGQTPGPSRERIFENAEFDTRSYELVQIDEVKCARKGPSPLLLCAAISHTLDPDLDDWYRREHVEVIAKCPGYRRTTTYKLATRSVLSAFVRSFPLAPKWLALHEFDGSEIPWKELATAGGTPWAKNRPPGISDIDFRYFRLRKVFEKCEKLKL